MRWWMPTTIVALALSAASHAQDSGPKDAPPKSLDLQQIEELENLQNAMDAVKRLQSSMESMTRKRRTDCLKAIGWEPFWTCIMDALPVAWSFADYVAITTRSKEENGYEKLDVDHKAAYDRVAPVRNKCVRAINTKP